MPIAANRRVFGGGTGARGIKFQPDANTVLWLPGQDDAYSATIRDRSGKGNNGTITGADWLRTSKGIWYLDLNGTTDFITCGNDASLNINVFTFRTWVKVPSIVGLDWVVSKNTEGPADGWRFGVSSGQMFFRDRTATQDTTFTSGADVGIWTHFDLVKLGTGAGQVLAYKNGVLDATTGTSSGTFNNSASLVLGRYLVSDADDCLTGSLALIQLTASTLSATQLINLYNQERHLFGV